MKKFIIRVVLFLLPLLLIVIPLFPFYCAGKMTGELDTMDDIILRQRDNPQALVGMAYNESTAYYKLKNANHYKTDVIALGTSRVMQFKEECFKASFYNCGGVINGTLGEYTNFLKNLEYTPRVVIVGIDTWHFNETWNNNSETVDSFEKIAPVKRGNFDITKSIATDWIKKKWKYRDIMRYKANIGFNGRVKDAGFMRDGSYYYGYVYRDKSSTVESRFARTFERINEGSPVFDWGERVDEDSLRELRELLAYCQENGIIVVGVLSPYAPGIYDTMVESGNYSFFDELIPACNDIFAEYDYEFYNYISGDRLGMSDEYFVDGFHGSDIVYANILLDMAHRGSIIGTFIDKDEIERLLEYSYSTLTYNAPTDN